MESLREVWRCWNKVTLFATFLWFPCIGVATFWQHDWPLSVILILFVVTLVSRGMVTWGIHVIQFEKEMDIPAFPEDLMEEFREMVF